MNNNPGETPNPLNPSGPKAQPEAPVATPATAAPAAAPATTEPATEAPAEAASTATKAADTKVASLDPTGRTMEQSAPATTESPKKKNTGLIVGLIVGLVVLIGGIAAAVAIVLNSNRGDAVAMAMQKIMKGESPKNVAIDGDINILLNDSSIPFKRININLDSDIMVGSMINTSSAVLTFTDSSNKDYSVEFNELYAESGDLYFEIEGASTALKESGILGLLYGGNTIIDCGDGETDCVESIEEVDTSGMTDAVIGVVKSAEGVWIRVSTDDLDLSGQSSLNNSTISCVTDLVNDVDKNSNSAAELYSKYPFIISSNENIPIASKQNPVYQVSLDSKNFTEFVNAIQNTEIAKSLYACMGWEKNLVVTEEDVEEVVAQMPKIYTEVSSDNNFTRLYLESDINDGVATATIDLGFGYPANINVSEPVEYKDYSEFIQEIFVNMYKLDYK